MKKLAFTMMEMIFVIVVIGIIAGGTFIQFSSFYEDLMQKQGSSELESEAKIVAEQVVARLSSSIKDSLVASDDLINTDCKGVSSLAAGDDNAVLSWIGRSDEANLGLWDTDNYKPGWSGFVDVSVSLPTSVSTKGSKLGNAETIINNLTGEPTPLSAANPIAAIYFDGSGSNTNACSDFFLNYATSKMYMVTANGDTNLERVVGKDFKNISEQYTLSHSAYAIQRVLEADGIPYLYLYSFRPWLGENAAHANAKKYLLGKNVSGFGFKWEGGLFRINICVKKTMSTGYDIEVCKEKAVF
jgi:prepilin-type N-terminal cleavage/methylation domain-containing protein